MGLCVSQHCLNTKTVLWLSLYSQCLAQNRHIINACLNYFIFRNSTCSYVSIFSSYRQNLNTPFTLLLLEEMGGNGGEIRELIANTMKWINSNVYVYVLSCVWICSPMDCDPLGFSVHGIFQAIILEWVAISSSRESSWSRNWTCVSSVSCIDRWILSNWHHHWNESTWTGQQIFMLNRCVDYTIRGISKSCFTEEKCQIKTIFQTKGESFI